MVKWGIIGAGNIAHRFAKALKHEPNSELIAISARKKEKADAFGDEFAVEKRYISHDDLLADRDIDAVYIALPHDMHCEWAIKSMKEGKAVLCEKPAVLNYAEMKKIADFSKEQKILFMEAMKTRFVPCYEVIKRKILEEKVIGEIRGIDTSLCNAMPMEEMKDTYHLKSVVGGALLDCGIYCASWLEDFCHDDFRVESVDYHMENSVDLYVNAKLIAGDLECSLETAFDRDKPRQAVIYGTAGKVVVDNLHRAESFTICADGKEPEQITVKYDVDDFYSQIHHFCDLLARGAKESPVMSLDSSLRCAELMDMIKVKMA